VAWPLLNALNHAEMRNNPSENESQLLKGCIEKLEQELGTLTGRKPILHLPIGQVCNISINNDQIPESTGFVDQENKKSKLDIESPILTDPLKVHPVITQKTKKVQDRPAGLPPDQWPPAQTHLYVTARPDKVTESIQ